MKQPIIIFTKSDDATKQYFDNLFTSFNSELDYWIFDESIDYIIFFIKDSTTNEIKELNTKLVEYRDSVPWIYYHIENNVSEQSKWMRACFKERKTYIQEGRGNNIANAGDHHNSDGKYYGIILRASQYFAKKELAKMNFELSKLG